MQRTATTRILRLSDLLVSNNFWKSIEIHATTSMNQSSLFWRSVWVNSFCFLNNKKEFNPQKGASQLRYKKIKKKLYDWTFLASLIFKTGQKCMISYISCKIIKKSWLACLVTLQCLFAVILKHVYTSFLYSLLVFLLLQSQNNFYNFYNRSIMKILELETCTIGLQKTIPGWLLQKSIFTHAIIIYGGDKSRYYYITICLFNYTWMSIPSYSKQNLKEVRIFKPFPTSSLFKTIAGNFSFRMRAVCRHHHIA